MTTPPPLPEYAPAAFDGLPPHGAAPAAPTDPEPARRSRGFPAWSLAVASIAGIALGASTTLGALLLGNAVAGAQPAFDLVHEQCGGVSSTSVAPDVLSLALDTQGTEDLNGDSVADVQCALDSLSAPDHVLEQMLQTRALDGRQSADWDDFGASWTYHPDAGLSILIKVAA